MYKITCCKEGCKTPHFYVNPKGGKIPLVSGLAGPAEMMRNSVDLIALSARNYKIMVQENKLNEEESKAFLNRYLSLLDKDISNNDRETSIEDDPKIIDYLLVYCESGHANYIPLVEKS